MLITEEHKRISSEHHLNNPKYGGGNYSDLEIARVRSLGKDYKIKTILDYGSGKGVLKKTLLRECPLFKVWNYEPALDIDQRQPVDLVWCKDVLPHVEPECVDDIIQDIEKYCQKVLYIQIYTAPSKTLMGDQDIRRITKPMEWWLEKMDNFMVMKIDIQKDKFIAEMIPCRNY